MTNRRILLVEDDPDLAAFMQAVLVADGFEVTLAADGRAGLDALEQRPYALVVLDLMMPGMDGWHFRVEQEHDAALAPIPVVVLSGATDVHRSAASLRAAEHINKPVSLDRLLATVRKYDPA